MNILKLSFIKETLILFDGPDFHFRHFNIYNNITFTASSYQVLVLYINYFNDIAIMFQNSITKKTINNYNLYKV